MSFFDRQILVLATLITAGCSFQSSDKTGTTSPTASWRLTPVQVVSSQSISGPVWALPVQRDYRLRVCVQDAATSTPRIGEQLSLSSGNQEQAYTLDAQGCMSWNESVAFRFLADETFAERQWEVRLGGEKQMLRLAFDPWAEGAKGLIDLGHEKAPTKSVPEPQAARALTHVSPRSTSNLVVLESDSPVWLSPQQNQANTVQPALLRFSVAAQHATFENEEENTPLLQGDLRLRAWLGEVRHGGTLSFFGFLKAPAKTHLQQGKLEARVEFQLIQVPNTTTDKVLFFELVPAEESAGIRRAFGRLALSGSAKIPESVSEKEWNQIVAPAMARLSHLDGPTVLNNIAKSPSPPLLRIVSYSAESAAEPNVERDWQATRTVNFHICLEPNLALYPNARDQLQDHRFEARWVGTDVHPAFVATENKNGCLGWKQVFLYPFAGIEQYWPGTLEVRSLTAPYEGFAAQVAFDVNPWSARRPGWDRALGEAPRNPRPEAPTLSVSSYTVNHLGSWAHLVDKYLQLTILRKVLFQFTPKLYRPYSFDHGLSYQHSLPQGLSIQVGVRFERADGKAVSDGLEKRVSDPAFLGEFKTIVTQSSSETLDAYGAIPIQFVHTMQWAARLRASVEISASDARVAPKGASKFGLFNGTVLRNDQESKILFEETPHAGTTILMGAKGTPPQKKTLLNYPTSQTHPTGQAYFVNHPWSKPPIEEYREALTRYVRVEGVKLSDEVPSVEAFSTEQATALASATCPSPKQFDNTSSAFHSAVDCQTSPLKYFQVGALRIADEVEPEAVVESTDHGSTKFSSTFFNERKFSQTEIKGHTFRQSFQGGVRSSLAYGKFDRGGGALTSFTLDNQHYDSEEGSFTQDWRNGIRGSSDISIERKQLRIRVRGKFAHCVSIRPLPTSISTWNLAARIICSAAKDETITESYYALADQAVHFVSPIVDTGEIVQRGWQKLIRGEDAFSAFDKILTDTTRGFLLKKIESFHDGIETSLAGALRDPLSKERRFLDGGVFPGVTDYVEYSDIKWSDYEIRRQADPLIARLIEKGVRAPVAARYGYCYVAELATLVSHERYKADPNAVREWEAALRKTGTEKRCHAFAIDGRWDKP